MAFNIDHTASGDLTFQGSHNAFTGVFTFPKPSVPNTTYTVLVRDVDINSISGLQTCLDKKVETDDVGTSISYYAGNGSGQIPILNQSNQYDAQIIPSVVINTAFVVTETSELTLLSSAKKGDTATVTANSSTYILTGSFNNSINWALLEREDNKINKVNNYTGSVLISGNDLQLTAGTLNGTVAQNSVQLLATGWTDDTCLTDNYETKTGLTSTLLDYVTCNCFTTTIADYIETGVVSNCMSLFTNDSDLHNLIDPYVLLTATGNAASINAGHDALCILNLEDDGFIFTGVLADVALHDNFTIFSTGDLITLTSATIGDTAVDYLASKNYILADSGVSAYADINNWKEFAVESGSVLSVDGISPDSYGEILLHSNDVKISGAGTNSVSDSITYIGSGLTDLDDTYQHADDFCSLTGNYTLTSDFDAAIATKSTTGHMHEMSQITGLNSCISKIHAFNCGNLIDLENSYSPTLDVYSLTTQTGSLMFGSEAKSNYPNEISLAPGSFVENGDAQLSEIVSRTTTSSPNWANLSSISIDDGSLMLVRASIIARSTSYNEYASYILEAAVLRQDGDVVLPSEVSKTIFAESHSSLDAGIQLTSSGFDIQVRGDNSTYEEIYWVGKVEMLNVKNGGAGGAAGEGKYFSGINNDWFDYANNWFTNNSMTNAASSLPSTGMDVVVRGSLGPLIDLDNVSFVTPNSINAIQLTDSTGVCFTSTGYHSFYGTIYGNASFFGNSSFND